MVGVPVAPPHSALHRLSCSSSSAHVASSVSIGEGAPGTGGVRAPLSGASVGWGHGGCTVAPLSCVGWHQRASRGGRAHL
eukprot:7204065-Prymnesium_polylepis.1